MTWTRIICGMHIINISPLCYPDHISLTAREFIQFYLSSEWVLIICTTFKWTPPPFLLPWLLLLLLLKKKDTILILITHLHAFVLIFWRNDIRVDWRKGGGGGGCVGLEYTFVHDILALSMFKCAKKKIIKLPTVLLRTI